MEAIGAQRKVGGSVSAFVGLWCILSELKRAKEPGEEEQSECLRVGGNAAV